MLDVLLPRKLENFDWSADVTLTGRLINSLLRETDILERVYTFSDGEGNVIRRGIMTLEEAKLYASQSNEIGFTHTTPDGHEYCLVRDKVAQKLADLGGRDGLSIDAFRWGEGIVAMQIFKDEEPILSLRSSQQDR